MQEETYQGNIARTGIGNTVSHTMGAMCLRKLNTKQKLPISLQEGWDFFCNPHNLAKITPPHMRFTITSPLAQTAETKATGIYSGQIITYRVNALPGIPMGWTTEIKTVKPPYFFIDEQRFGPYAFWHHQHHLSPIAGGVEMLDIVHYRLPTVLEIIPGVNHLFHWPIRKELNKIFQFRYETLQNMFPWPKKIRSSATGKKRPKMPYAKKTEEKRKAKAAPNLQKKHRK